MMNPVALSIISQVFYRPVERAARSGSGGGVVGISMALGPDRRWFHSARGLAGGVLDQPAHLCGRHRADGHLRSGEQVGDHAQHGPDRPDSAVLTLFGTVFALIEGPALGWSEPPVLGVIAMAVVSLAGFLRYETRRADPFIDLRFFS